MKLLALVVLATPLFLGASARSEEPLDTRAKTAVDTAVELDDCLSRPIQVSETTFARDVLHNSLPVLVHFWATWSGPDRMIAPDLERIAEEHCGDLVVAKIDVDSNPTLAKEYEVTAVPTLLLFENGRELGRLLGVLPKSAIESFVLDSLSRPELSE